MKHISQQQLDNILSLLDQGISSIREIASLTGVHYSTVSRVRSQYRGNLEKGSGGHPPKLSDTAKRHAMQLIGSGQADTAIDVAKKLQNTLEQPVSVETIRRGLKEGGLKSVTKKKAPYLSAKHKKARLDFALAHKDWTVDD